MFGLEPAVASATIALLSFLFTVIIGGIAMIVRGVYWLHREFAAIKAEFNKILDDHEIKDQERHEDNLQRFTRLETLVINGHKEKPSEEWNTRQR